MGSETLSGSYVTSCYAGAAVDSMASSSTVPSDTKSIAWAFVVNGNDNVSDEYQGFSDSTCTTKSFHLIWVYDNVSVGSASGSNYKVSLPLTSIQLLVNTTAAETWIEAMLTNLAKMKENLEESDKIKHEKDIEKNRQHLANLKDKTSEEWRDYATLCMVEIMENKKKK